MNDNILKYVRLGHILAEQAEVFYDLAHFKVDKHNKSPSDLMRWFNKLTPQERKMYKLDYGGTKNGYQIVRISTDDWFEDTICDTIASTHYNANYVMKSWNNNAYDAKITGLFACFSDDPSSTEDIFGFSLEVKDSSGTVNTLIHSYHRSLDSKDINSIESFKKCFNIAPNGMIDLTLLVGSNVRLIKTTSGDIMPDIIMLPINVRYAEDFEVDSD